MMKIALIYGFWWQLNSIGRSNNFEENTTR